jgi:hypothetical protein
MTKFYAKVSAAGKDFVRYVARDFERLSQTGRPFYKTTAERGKAFQFASEEEAEAAARALILERYGKPFSGGVSRFQVEPVRRMDAFLDFHKNLGDEILKKTEGVAVHTARIHESEMAEFMETFEGAEPKPAEVCPSFDWEGAGEDIYASLAAIVDQIDYTNQACGPAEPVGALLDPHLIGQAKERLSKWMNLRIKAKSQNGDGVGG